jgi:hypothetical protein
MKLNYNNSSVPHKYAEKIDGKGFRLSETGRARQMNILLFSSSGAKMEEHLSIVGAVLVNKSLFISL